MAKSALPVKRGIPRRMILIAGAVLAVAVAAYVWLRPSSSPIRVGILHSRTGPMAISENSMVDGELLAIEQINAAGGLNHFIST